MWKINERLHTRLTNSPIIPFHSPFSFFFPNVLSLTISISNVKLSLSAKSSKISIQNPTNLVVELLPFGAKTIQFHS